MQKHGEAATSQFTAQEPPISTAATENEDAETIFFTLHRESSEEKKHTHTHTPFGLSPDKIIQIACSQNILN